MINTGSEPNTCNIPALYYWSYNIGHIQDQSPLLTVFAIKMVEQCHMANYPR